MKAKRAKFVDRTYPEYIERTVKEMRSIVANTTIDDYPHDEIEAAQQLPAHGLMSFLLARYRKLRYNGERVVSPRIFRAQRGGDCDNWTVYLCGLYHAIGHKPDAGLKYTNTLYGRRFYHAFAILDGVKADPWNPTDTDPASTGGKS